MPPKLDEVGAADLARVGVDAVICLNPALEDELDEFVLCLGISAVLDGGKSALENQILIMLIQQ